jgi:hypothetical protein
MDGDWIKEEYKIYEVMQKKIADTNETYQEIAQNNELIDKEKGMAIRYLPEIQLFKYQNTFNDELTEFLEIFHKTKELPVNSYNEKHGIPVYETKQIMRRNVNEYTECCKTLLRYPWRIDSPYVSDYLNNLFIQLINGVTGTKLLYEIEEDNSFSFNGEQIEYDGSYPFVYITHHVFQVNIKGMPEKIKIIFALGKRQNGLYHILSPRFCEINNINEMMSLFANLHIKHILYIITDRIIPIPIINKMIIDRVYISKYILSLTSIIKVLNKLKVKNNGCELNDDDINKIAMIFNRPNFDEAYRYIKQYMHDNDENKKYIIGELRNMMKRIEPIYHYPILIRSIIGTTNINYLISYLIEVIISNRQFYNRKEANDYIIKALRKIMKYGKEFIPNWDILSQPIFAS